MALVKLTDRKLQGLKPKDVRAEYRDTSLPDFGVRVTPNGIKSFFLMYRIGAQRRRYTLGNYPVLTLADARDLAKDALELVRKGIDPIEELKRREEAERKRRQEETSFEDLATLFLNEHVTKLKSVDEVWRSFNTYLIPKFGKVAARRLTRSEIREYFNQMAKETPVMANRCLAYTRKMYAWALGMDLVEFNPCAGIPRPGIERQRDRVLTEDEIKSLWKALDKEKPVMAATFRLRLLTAQRGGEVHSMRWEDIDGDWWTIPPEVSKNGLTHRVPLSPQAMRVIEQVKRISGNCQWLFPNPKRTDHVYECQKLAQRVRKNSGIEFRAHDLRRTAASMMTGMGIPRLVVGKILNHAEPGVTKVYDRYSYDAEKRQALDAWAVRVVRLVSELKPVAVEKRER